MCYNILFLFQKALESGFQGVYLRAIVLACVRLSVRLFVRHYELFCPHENSDKYLVNTLRCDTFCLFIKLFNIRNRFYGIPTFLNRPKCDDDIFAFMKSCFKLGSWNLKQLVFSLLKSQTLICLVCWSFINHYSDVIMGAMVYQITILMISYSTVYSVTDQRKHQSSASLAFVWGTLRWPMNSRHKGPVTWKMFAFHDVIMHTWGGGGGGGSHID